MNRLMERYQNDVVKSMMEKIQLFFKNASSKN